ncbi:MAG TPA: GNAT family N-acetyltransferase [Rhizomicrobium sp.]|nr:GNAT family N-acetyltransferase [Rhizomicrobium sp.]
MKLLAHSPYESILPPTESIRSQMSFISASEALKVSDMLKTLRTGMPQPQKRLASEESARAGKHRLDEMNPARVAKHLVMFQPTEQGVADILAQARLSIPGIAETEEVLKVVRFNPICILGLCRKSKFNSVAPVAEGFIGILPLNALGLQILALGSFDASNPDTRLLAKPDERPAGLYMWAVFAPGPLAAGMALLMEKISSPQYAGVNLYSRPNTEAGRKYNEVLGATEGVTIDGIHAPHVWMFPRAPQAPLYDSYVPGAAPGEIGVTIARNFEDLGRVIAMRSAVYIGEQECPYDEEYDGNDLAATHLLVYVGDEPAGCLRVRFFADFAKIERLVVRKEFRKTRAAFHVVRAGFKLCQAKGYRRVYGHSQTRLVNFWGRFGFRVMEGREKFVFSDFDYVEIVADIEPDADAVRIGCDPYVIIRPEGRWHKPGILEKSASRAVTNPSIVQKR